MEHELISKKTRSEFREYSVGTTLRVIRTEFDGANVPLDEYYEPPEQGERRSLVEQYYHATDFTKWSDVRKVLTVYGNVLADLETRAESLIGYNGGERAKSQFELLKKWIEREGFTYTDGKIGSVAKDLHLPEVSEAAKGFDSLELHQQVERIKGSVEDDPALAMGTAKEVVETTCKTILKARGIEFQENSDVVDLVTADPGVTEPPSRKCPRFGERKRHH